MAQRISVDPVTRIEGHLRMDCEVDNGRITDAWTSGTMYRGIENIVRGLDPREAWIYVQRICGVCTTVHALASVRAVENALQMEIPINAQYIRNMIISAHGVVDHVVHFYQLSALDWVDITSALRADVNQTAQLAQQLSDWPRNSRGEFKAVQERLKDFVASGQLGIFGSGYWDHPAMELSPEVNLMATTHYLQALEYQRSMNKIVAILGSKTPNIQNMAVGGVANPADLNAPAPLTMERLDYIKSLIDEVQDFVKKVYLVDVAAVGAHYMDWTQYGAGVINYLSVPDLPMDTKGQEFLLPGGYIENGDLDAYQPITSFQDSFFEDNVKEGISHAWYEGDWQRHPYAQVTEPNYTGFDPEGKYSWVKAPTFKDKPAQVGPLAHVLAMYVSGHEPTQRYLQSALDIAGDLADTEIPLNALHSTIGRHAARAVRTAVLSDTLADLWQGLVNNIGKGDLETYNPPSFPEGEIQGFGFHEAPRGTLSHWVVIENGRIRNYQCVVPTTWNAAPRNHRNERGPYEASLIDNPIADPDRPLEVLRTVHSFDPCLACAVHMHDENLRDRVKVKAL